MIISCPSCQTQFRVDESRLAPEGKKVRCSKCGHVWRAMAIGQPTPEAPSAEQPAPAPLSAQGPGADVAPDTTPEVAPPAPEAAERAEPVLSARDRDAVDGEDDNGESTVRETDGAEPPEKEDSGANGLTDDQRANLAAARQPKPRSRSWFKVILILLILAGLLVLAYRNLPPEILEKINPAMQQPADVGAVEAKPVPADPAKGGHIVGDEPPASLAPQ